MSVLGKGDPQVNKFELVSILGYQMSLGGAETGPSFFEGGGGGCPYMVSPMDRQMPLKTLTFQIFVCGQ